MYDAAIIGGGLAGLLAARDLRDAGKSVIVIEARQRLGGRTFYAPFPGTERHVELGGNHIVTAVQPHLRREIERYGLRVGGTPIPTTYGWHLAGQDRSGSFPVPPAELQMAERVLYESIKASHRIEPGAPYEAGDVADLDVALSTWLTRVGATGATRDLIETFVSFAFGTADETSALQVLGWMANFGNSSWMLWAGLEEKFADGTARLVEALAGDADADLRLGAAVSGVTQDENSVLITTTDGERIEARGAVIAVPLNLLRDIEFKPALAREKLEATAQGHAGRATKVWARVTGVDRVVFSCGSDTDAQLVMVDDELPGGDRLVVMFAARPEDLTFGDDEAAARALAQHLPAANIVQTLAHDWNADPFSQGAYLAYRPGQLTRLGPGLRRPEGRLAFAGSDLAIRWPGMIEGALESGAAAAAHLLDAELV
jgi:monoamine oxidase